MKKIFLLASIIILCLSVSACSSGSSFRSGTSLNDSTEQSDNGSKSLSVEKMIENFEPPANIVSADMTAEDPSNDEIVFTFQEDGKIQNCVYRMNGEKGEWEYGQDLSPKSIPGNHRGHHDDGNSRFVLFLAERHRPRHSRSHRHGCRRSGHRAHHPHHVCAHWR